MSSRELYSYITKEFGLNVESIKSTALKSAIKKRIERLSIESAELYLEVLRSNPHERQLLAELFVVSETWFFRDRALFNYLGGHIHGLYRRSLEPISILSAPCASGEEPYSLAITALNSGLPLSSCAIDACDISQQNVELAQAGSYRNNSMREPLLPNELKYFTRPTPDCYQIDTQLLQQINFFTHNLVQPLPMFSHQYQYAPRHYDIILCRNLLIYLTPQVQQIVLRNLLSVLHPSHGVLVLTPAEAALARGLPVESHKGFTYVFSFAKIKSAEKESRSKKKVSHVSQESIASKPEKSDSNAASFVREESAPAPQVSYNLNLERIQALADSGELDRALPLAQSLVEFTPYCTHARYLLALISDALGQDEAAIKEYRRILYIDPHHCGALEHLSIHEYRRGNVAMASRLRTRLRQRVH